MAPSLLPLRIRVSWAKSMEGMTEMKKGGYRESAAGRTRHTQNWPLRGSVCEEEGSWREVDRQRLLSLLFRATGHNPRVDDQGEAEYLILTIIVIV
jgi:hypothetical protein